MRRIAASLGPDLLLLLVILLWSSTFIITKAVFFEMGPLAFTFARFLLMQSVAFAVLAAKARANSGLWSVRRSDIPRFVLVGMLGYTCYQLGFVLGLERTSPFASSLIIAMVPLFTLVILACAREPTPLMGWVGLAVAFAGVLLFLSDTGTSSVSLFGDALSAGSSVSFALYGLLNRKLVRSYAAPTYSAYTLLGGTVPLLLICLPGALAQDWRVVSPLAWAAVAYMAVFPVYLAYQVWNFAISRRGAGQTSSFSLLIPVVSGVASAILFDELFGPFKVIGAALVLLGMVLPRVAPLLWRRASVPA